MKRQKRNELKNQKIDRNLKFRQVVREKKLLSLCFIVTLLVVVFCMIKEVGVLMERPSYEITKARFKNSVEDGTIRVNHGEKNGAGKYTEETAYRYCYSFEVENTEYLVDSQQRTRWSEPIEKELLIRYKKDDPSVACPQSMNMIIIGYLASLAVLLIIIIEFLDVYYKKKTGYGYSQIVLSFVVSIGLLIEATNIAFLIAFEGGYYGAYEAVKNHPVLSVVSVILIGISCLGLYDSFPKIRKHHRDYGNK